MYFEVIPYHHQGIISLFNKFSKHDIFEYLKHRPFLGLLLLLLSKLGSLQLGLWSSRGSNRSSFGSIRSRPPIARSIVMKIGDTTITLHIKMCNSSCYMTQFFFNLSRDEDPLKIWESNHKSHSHPKMRWQSSFVLLVLKHTQVSILLPT